MGIEQTLADNAGRYYKWAEDAFTEGDYNVSITLHFKLAAEVCDLLLFSKTRRITSNHTERFRLLEKLFPDVYLLLDTLFSIYQKTYTAKMNLNEAEAVRKNVLEIARLAKVDINI